MSVKNHDVLLISPHIDYDKFMSPIFSDSKISMGLPIGLLSIAQHLFNKGHNVKVLHLPIEYERTKEQIGKILKKNYSDLILIQCHWYLYGAGAVKIANYYKEYFPDSKIFLGGFHASYFYEDILKNYKSVDGIILCEGEKIADELINKSFGKVSGIAYRNDGKIILNQANNDSLLNINEIPLIDPKSSIYKGLEFGKYFFMNFSRGKCVKKCAYCVGNNKKLNIRTFQNLPISKILDQIRLFSDAKVKEIFMGEIEFLGRNFIEELALRIKNEKLDTFFRLETNPLLFTKITTKKLSDAKFYRFAIGCESGSDIMLRKTNRNIDSSVIMTAVKNIRKNHGHVLTSWIANLPGETTDDFNRTLALMKKAATSGANVYWVENLHVLPGSEFFENPNKFGINPLFNSFNKWQKWAAMSKNYIDFKDIEKNPIKYFTHTDNNTNINLMADRFIKMRRLATNASVYTLNHIKNEVDDYIYNSEIESLKWYINEGHKMLLF